MRYWRDYITIDRGLDHGRWINDDRPGEGPLEHLEDIDFSGFRFSGKTFDYTTFVRCKFSDTGIEYSGFDGATFFECWSDTANLSHSSYYDASFEFCRLPKIDFRWCRFFYTLIEGSSFDGSSFADASFIDATIRNSSFRGCRLAGTQLDKSYVLDCDFRDADLTSSPNGGRNWDTHFENCDFRGADFTDRRFRDTTFTRCKFAGVKGRAVLEGPVHVIEPDFSDAGDGSDIRSAEAVLALWR
ncbi:MAG: pentapeptide repeat-containing protein [Kofleriaceae bacterium]